METAVLTQWEDSWFPVPAALDDDAAVHQHVAEEEEDLWLWPPSALFHQAALPEQNPTWFGELCPGGTEIALRHFDGLMAPLVHCSCCGWLKWVKCKMRLNFMLARGKEELK